MPTRLAVLLALALAAGCSPASAPTAAHSTPKAVANPAQDDDRSGLAQGDGVVVHAPDSTAVVFLEGGKNLESITPTTRATVVLDKPDDPKGADRWTTIRVTEGPLAEKVGTVYRNHLRRAK